MNILAEPAIEHIVATMTEDRRWFHEHAELGLHERLTLQYLNDRLVRLGYVVTVCGGGLTAQLPRFDASRVGNRFALRADIDGLPIEEAHNDNRPCRSLHKGVMHACGHDGHMAIALGVATWYAAADLPDGPELRFCFQPAEEITEGAELMIADGAMKDIDCVIGLHLWLPLNVGQVAIVDHAIFAHVDNFQITVTGRGGHGGMPHTTVDPVTATAALIQGIQTIISRELSPADQAVLTIGSIHGGTARNIVPDTVTLSGTVRTFDATVQSFVLDRLKRLCTAIADAHRCTAVVDVIDRCPAVLNDPKVAGILRTVAQTYDDIDLQEGFQPITIGDDMSFFQQEVPGCYLLVGAGNDHMHVRSHHQASFDLDEGCLPVGAALLIHGLLELNRHASAF